MIGLFSFSARRPEMDPHKVQSSVKNALPRGHGVHYSVECATDAKALKAGLWAQKATDQDVPNVPKWMDEMNPRGIGKRLEYQHTL